MHPFSLLRYPTFQAASQAVAQDPAGRRFRAGGIDLLDLLKEGLIAPDELVELAAVGEAQGATMAALGEVDGRTSVGARLTLTWISQAPQLGGAYGAFAQAARSAATPAIRNVATLGGNLLQRPRCWYFRHADLQCLKKGGAQCFALTGDNRYHAIFGGGPSFIVHPSSLAVALLALDARVRLATHAGERELGIAELFVAPGEDVTREHRLAPGEVLLAAVLPAAAPGQRSVYLAAKEKQSHDWPLVEAAVRCSLHGGRMTQVRVALGHVAPVPWRVEAAEAVLEGQAPNAALFERAAEAAVSGAKALEHNGYKIPLSKGLLRQALHQVTGVARPE